MISNITQAITMKIAKNEQLMIDMDQLSLINNIKYDNFSKDVIKKLNKLSHEDIAFLFSNIEAHESTRLVKIIYFKACYYNKKMMDYASQGLFGHQGGVEGEAKTLSLISEKFSSVLNPEINLRNHLF